LISGCSQQIICNKPYILVGTECCLDNNNDSICDEDEVMPTNNIKEEKSNEQAIVEDTSEIQTPIVSSSDELIQSNELPTRNFTIEELQDFINELENRINLFTPEDDENIPYVIEAKNKGQSLVRTNKETKYWVIHIINDSNKQLEDANDFYNFVKSPDWQAWRYYINETTWKWLYKPLEEDELKELLPKYKYIDYINSMNSDWVDYDVEENPVTTSQGNILKFDMGAMIFDQFGYWQGNWENQKLIYKIPCTKDVVVYLRPRWGIGLGNTGHWNQKKETAVKNWEEDVRLTEPKILNYSNEIMRFCGIKKNMFEEVDFDSYEYHSTLVNNWKVYFRVLFNYSFDVDFSIKEGSYPKTYLLKDINLTFVSYDKNDFLKNCYLSVEILINDSGKVKDYLDQSIKGGRIKVEEKVTKFLEKDSSESFGENATIIFKPYLGWEDVGENYKYYIGSPIVKKVDYTQIQ